MGRQGRGKKCYLLFLSTFTCLPVVPFLISSTSLVRFILSSPLLEPPSNFFPLPRFAYQHVDMDPPEPHPFTASTNDFEDLGQ